MSFKKRIGADDTIKLLNEMLEADPEATSQLVNYRVPCNEDLGAHPTIQVGSYPDGNGPIRVGLIGVLNGQFGTDERGWGCIAAIYDDDGTLLRFEKIRGGEDEPTKKRSKGEVSTQD